MRYVVLLLLVACASHPVVKWVGATTGENVRIEMASNGEGSYINIVDGADEEPDRIVLDRSQVKELGELLRSHHACQLKHEPGYTPTPGEGQTTLVLTFDDQTCTVTLWDTEWQRGDAHDITETMRSMRPLHRSKKNAPRQLNPRM